jgi:hypothetical protein
MQGETYIDAHMKPRKSAAAVCLSCASIAAAASMIHTREREEKKKRTDRGTRGEGAPAERTQRAAAGTRVLFRTRRECMIMQLCAALPPKPRLDMVTLARNSVEKGMR